MKLNFHFLNELNFLFLIKFSLIKNKNKIWFYEVVQATINSKVKPGALLIHLSRSSKYIFTTFDPSEPKRTGLNAYLYWPSLVNLQHRLHRPFIRITKLFWAEGPPPRNTTFLTLAIDRGRHPPDCRKPASSSTFSWVEWTLSHSPRWALHFSKEK